MIMHLFITQSGDPLPHWREAFSSVCVETCFKKRNNLPISSEVVWVEWPKDLDERHYQELSNLVSLGKPVVVMSPVPNFTQAQTAMSLGAKGYCHSYATSKQLREVAIVVSNGGLWLGPDLIKRIIASTASVAASQDNDAEKTLLQDLTKKEKLVASFIAKGLTNKEIAQELEIGERTVKSHITTIFQKLDVRDRVQLALLLNSIKIQTS